jgi:transposase
MWAGRGVAMTRALPAAELMGLLVAKHKACSSNTAERRTGSHRTARPAVRPKSPHWGIECPRNKALVKETWQSVAPMEYTAARLFYDRFLRN